MIDTAIPNKTQTRTQYPAYKDSGVDWLGEIPAHWEVRQLKRVSEMLVSNIDKHTKPNEISVRLCNYVDVYKNDFITKDLLFTSASASPGEMKRFRIKINDVIITKDSEDWLDIGVPAFVKYEAEDLVCGYHLAILRSNGLIVGSFLHRAFQSTVIKTQLSIKANGVTRYGLSHNAIQSAFLPIPPLSEQTRIAEFLDRKTAHIDQAIAQKERLIELLNERRQVMIHQAVTRGLDSSVPMKDSGIDWISEIPAHWEVSRINWLFVEKDETGYPNLPLLIVSINSGVTLRDMDDNENRKQLAEDFNVYKRTLAGDIAFNKMRMWQGAVGVVPQDGLVSPDYVVARPNYFVNSAFYGFLFKTREYLAEFIKHSHGIAWDRNRLYWDDFKNIFAVVPPLEEQNQIVEFLDAQQKEVTFATKLIQRQIQKLQELKSTLINSAVTGKIKV